MRRMFIRKCRTSISFWVFTDADTCTHQDLKEWRRFPTCKSTGPPPQFHECWQKTRDPGSEKKETLFHTAQQFCLPRGPSGWSRCAGMEAYRGFGLSSRRGILSLRNLNALLQEVDAEHQCGAAIFAGTHFEGTTKHSSLNYWKLGYVDVLFHEGSLKNDFVFGCVQSSQHFKQEFKYLWACFYHFHSIIFINWGSLSMPWHLTY